MYIPEVFLKAHVQNVWLPEYNLSALTSHSPHKHVYIHAHTFFLQSKQSPQ